MTRIKEIIFKKGIPSKNIFIQIILNLKWPLMFPCVNRLIKRNLKHCKDIYFSYGIRYFYGNIYADKVSLGDTFFLDYAPVYIGEGSKFSFENMVITSTHDRNNFEIVRAKPVFIGKNVWVTSRCVILGGVRIGDNTIIGAGSVVTHNIPANCFAAGNPCKVIKKFK